MIIYISAAIFTFANPYVLPTGVILIPADVFIPLGARLCSVSAI